MSRPVRVPGLTRPTSAGHIAEARMVRSLLAAGWPGGEAELARGLYRRVPADLKDAIARLAETDPAKLRETIFAPTEGPEAA